MCYCCILNQAWLTKFNERTKHFFIKVYLILFSKGAHCLLLVWEVDGETYTQRGDFFLTHSFFREPGSANACTPSLAPYRQKRPNASDRLRVFRSTPILCTLSKSACVVLITWSPSGYTPVGLDCPETLSCLLITTRQLVEAHRVTRNEPKIHVIYYITLFYAKAIILEEL